MKALVTFLIVVLMPLPLTKEVSRQLIIWNVGQGQWVTLSYPDRCIHIDMGGEFWDRKALLEECGSKLNQLLFTHADWDHISFLPQVIKNFSQVCRGSISSIEFKQTYFRQIYNDLPLCPSSLLKRPLNWNPEFLKPRRHKRKSLSRNDLSHIWVIDNILIPGDSTAIAEKIWAQKLTSKLPIQYLVIAHHGSRTSSSEQLLIRLKNLKLAIASSRRAVYGHPHTQILVRYRRFTIPVLTTEFWGDIRIAY